jgi:addiction module HigA family antidote
MLHPGPELKSLLKGAGFKQEAIAAQLGIQPSQFSEILSGKRPFTPHMCLAMERVFGLKAQDWNRKQADYDLAQARLTPPPASYTIEKTTPETQNS